MSGRNITTDVVRDAVRFPRNRLGEPRTIEEDDFEAWLAREKAEAAAAALERAASEMPSTDYSDSGLFHRPMTVSDLRHWLRKRATALREQEI